MKRHVLSLAAVLACAALAGVIVAIAVSSASGTPGGSMLPTPRLGGGSAPPSVSVPACSVAGSRGASDIAVSGVCTGRLKDTFACVKGGGALALSVRRPLGGRAVFYLTVVISDYLGPGPYPEAEAFAQIVGPPSTLRWTDRDVLTRVDPSGAVELGRAALHAERGTPATGTIRLYGHAACSD